MKITKKWLKEKGACNGGAEWFLRQKETDGVKVVKKLIEEKHLDWANWLIVRIMDYKQYVGYAVYAAEQVIDIYEKKYPGDDRPRRAIEAARKCIDNPSEENKKAAAHAASATYAADYAAAYAAYAAAYAAYAAAYAAAHAAHAASAARSARSAAYAADYAADYAAAHAAYDAAYAEMELKILTYGLALLAGEKGAGR